MINDDEILVTINVAKANILSELKERDVLGLLVQTTKYKYDKMCSADRRPIYVNRTMASFQLIIQPVSCKTSQ